MISDGSYVEFGSSWTASHDLFINATGYEHRSAEFARRELIRAKQWRSISFNTPGELSYDENVSAMKQVGARFWPANEAGEGLQRVLKQFDRPISVGIDISSMTRTMLAEVIFLLIRSKSKLRSLRIYYTPQKYLEPELNFPKMGGIRAILPELSGFDANPDLPVSLAMGLGYEYGLALGIIDFKEPSRTVCFTASGLDERFDAAVRAANFDYDFGPSDVAMVTYTLTDPRAAYRYIDDIVYGLTSRYRVEIVPMGPKLFAAYSVLLGIAYFGHVTVLRVPSDPDMRKQAYSNRGFIYAEVDLEAAPAIEDISTSFGVERDPLEPVLRI